MEVIVLAAGQGKRMRSVLPKVLQPLAAKPMLAHVLDTAGAGVHRGGVRPRRRGGARSPGRARSQPGPPSGPAAGHRACPVQQAMPLVEDGDIATLILYGDVP